MSGEPLRFWCVECQDWTPVCDPADGDVGDALTPGGLTGLPELGAWCDQCGEDYHCDQCGGGIDLHGVCTFDRSHGSIEETANISTQQPPQHPAKADQ